MTTNLLGATVEITDDYSRGVHPPTVTRAVIRAVEIPSAGVRLVVMREDGTLRTVEGTGTGDTVVRVVAEEKAEDPIRRVVRVMRLGPATVEEIDEIGAALAALTPDDLAMVRGFLRRNL